jgi:hypothetical protein
MTPELFRRVLVASWLLVIVGAVVSTMVTSKLPEPLRAHVESTFDPDRPLTSQELVLVILVVPLLVVLIWNLIELLRFRARARPVYMGVMLAGLVLTPLTGPYVETGIVTAMYYASVLLAGIVIAAMWWVPAVATRFEQVPRADRIDPDTS